MHRRDALKTIAGGAATTGLWVQQLSALAQVHADHLQTALVAAQTAGGWVAKHQRDRHA
jgi:hypothetical protein